jgi:hypothetical protein
MASDFSFARQFLSKRTIGFVCNTIYKNDNIGPQVPVFMYAATITKPLGGQSCNIFWPFNDDNEDAGNDTAFAEPDNGTVIQPHVLNGQTAFTFYSFVLGFAIPLLLILVFYVQVRPRFFPTGIRVDRLTLVQPITTRKVFQMTTRCTKVP